MIQEQTFKNKNKIYRQQLTQCKRIVVKVGTRLLVDGRGRLNRVRINALVVELAKLHKSGKQVVFVTSGAVGAGLSLLGLKARPKEIPNLQMAAAVGQTRLIKLYYDLFQEQRCDISQVLLTHADLKHRGRHLNARNTMLNLLNHHVIPIVNENDVVTVDELRFGDNDMLSALVTALIDADLLILLTSPNGLQKFLLNQKMKRVPYIEKIDSTIEALVQPNADQLSLGGMASKLQAAELAAKTGAQVIIASGKQKNILEHLLKGDDFGTLIGKQAEILDKRKRWISFFHRSQGTLFVDSGARQALQARGKSLLPSGIKKVEGNFTSGSLINIATEEGKIIGHGLSEYSRHEIEKIMGKQTQEIFSILPEAVREEVIHRDNMIIFPSE